MLNLIATIFSPFPFPLTMNPILPLPTHIPILWGIFSSFFSDDEDPSLNSPAPIVDTLWRLFSWTTIQNQPCSFSVISFLLLNCCSVYSNYEELLHLCDLSPACVCFQEWILGSPFCPAPAYYVSFTSSVLGLQYWGERGTFWCTCPSYNPVTHGCVVLGFVSCVLSV